MAMTETQRAHLSILAAVAISEDEGAEHPFDGHCSECM
jgi:hypothetical protein